MLKGVELELLYCEHCCSITLQETGAGWQQCTLCGWLWDGERWQPPPVE